MILQRLRNVGLAGTGIFMGCIWPLILFCATVVVSWGLWDALGWPAWILWIGFILLFFAPTVFLVMLFVALVAGFFKGAWQWSLAVPGLIVFTFGGNVLLGLLFKSFERGSSVDPYWPDPVPLPDEEGPLIVDRQPMWMRPISATIGRLGAPLISIVLGTLAPFKPGPKSSDEDIRKVAEGFTKANYDDRLELQLGSSMPLRNMRRIWRRKGLCLFGKIVGILSWPVLEIMKALCRMDCYDPYAHSIALYHRDSAILAHELGHAEDFAKRKWRTLYICGRVIIPLVLLYQEWKASRLGAQNLRERGLVKELKRANRVFGGGFASYIGVRWFATGGMVLAALVGQAVGALFKPFGKPMLPPAEGLPWQRPGEQDASGPAADADADARLCEAPNPDRGRATGGQESGPATVSGPADIQEGPEG